MRRLGAAGMVLLMAALAGCGPGSGGTGTGPGPVPIGFSGSFTFSSVASATGLPPWVGPAGADACGPDACAQVSLQLAQDRVDLTIPCARFVFEGAWGAAADGLAVLDGRIEGASGASGAPPAVLRLQFSGPVDSSLQLTATLMNGQGQVLFGPASLGRTAAAQAAPAPACSVVPTP